MNYLVELEDVEELEELPVLLSVLQLDVVLLQAVEGQLGLVVDVDFHGLKKRDVDSFLVWGRKVAGKLGRDCKLWTRNLRRGIGRFKGKSVGDDQFKPVSGRDRKWRDTSGCVDNTRELEEKVKQSTRW